MLVNVRSPSLHRLWWCRSPTASGAEHWLTTHILHMMDAHHSRSKARPWSNQARSNCPSEAATAIGAYLLRMTSFNKGMDLSGFSRSGGKRMPPSTPLPFGGPAAHKAPGSFDI
eukprot:1409572-Alexandrium_andersonii.AAC.1